MNMDTQYEYKRYKNMKYMIDMKMFLTEYKDFGLNGSSVFLKVLSSIRPLGVSPLESILNYMTFKKLGTLSYTNNPLKSP